MPPDGKDPLYLALDQGGHASRALVFDAHGATVARALREVREFHPRPDWVEQDPEELVASLLDASREVERDLGSAAARIAAVGLATQRSSLVCWDRISGEPLSPVLSWLDRRAHAWLARFAPHAEAVHATTGLMLSAHYGASKMRWCLDHLPRVAEAAAEKRLAIGPLASFLTFRLTEERTLVADPANAARTLLWSPKTLGWDEGLLHLFDIPRALLPDCVPNRFDFGRRLGGHRPPLRFVTGDQSAALFAFGPPNLSNAYLNMGTGAFVQRVSGSYPGRHPRLLTGMVLHDADETVYTLEGTVNGAGGALVWAEANLGLENIVEQLPGWMERADEPPLFLNGVGGLGAPFWVAEFESRFSAEAESWQKAVAVAESIVFLVQANLDEFRRLASPLEGIIAGGGLATVDALCRRLSDLSGLSLYRPVEREATARGLAWLLAGKPHDWPEPEFGVWFKPRANPALRARYERWRVMMHEATGY